jgi:hypothetical protein
MCNLCNNDEFSNDLQSISTKLLCCKNKICLKCVTQISDDKCPYCRINLICMIESVDLDTDDLSELSDIFTINKLE